MTEKDCLQALKGRIIKDIAFDESGEEYLRIETQDGLIFHAFGVSDSEFHEAYVQIEQINE